MLDKNFYPNGDPAWSGGFLKRVKIAEEQRKREKKEMEDIHGEGGSFVSSFETEITKEYVELLEKRIVELGEENKDLQARITAVEHNRELTIKWARGEIEN